MIECYLIDSSRETYESNRTNLYIPWDRFCAIDLDLLVFVFIALDPLAFVALDPFVDVDLDPFEAKQ